MKLSELKTGESGIIVKVQGHGGFRKRIVEMGFIRGQRVDVLLNAPLHDPVKYKLMGYEVSLRHDEAALIEVEKTQESTGDITVTNDDKVETQPSKVQECEDASCEKGGRKTTPLHSRETISVALIGNPNCGKTSLFNYASGAHARVGNYSGVTVDSTEASAEYFGYKFRLTDLPGTYSLSCYSPEELYVRRHLSEEMPDVVINVIDASNLERNLYLTTQLVDMNLRVVCALNMFDEFERRGDSVDLGVLSQLMGVPMVPTSFKSGRGVEDLFRTVIEVYEDENVHSRHIHINYGHEIENGIVHIQKYIKADPVIRREFSTRYVALKLLEHDTDMEQYIRRVAEDNSRRIFAARDVAAARVYEETDSDSESAIMDAKYGFIHGALTEANYNTGIKKDTFHRTNIIDNIMSNRYLGFPLFFLMLYLMFQVTFSLGQYPMDWIEDGIGLLGRWVNSSMDEGPLRSLLTEGVIGGGGSVIVFLPQILILYFFIALMEDSGYMARAAFIMDKLMHHLGLHGKSFIPLIMGFGCNVPAVMATRMIESRRSRLITMMILPFMSCSARLPIYIMITGTFFTLQYRSMVMISLYAIGIVISVLVSRILSRFVIKGEDTPFVMELPPYRFPTSKALMRHTWDKGREYLKKMGGIILVASVIVWALGYFPHNDNLTPQEQKEQSYIGMAGRTIEPLFAPQGFNWKLDVSLIAGVGAKEIVASTVGVLYANDDSFGDDDSYSDDNEKYEEMHSLMQADGITPLSAYSYLIFVLLYFPCIATIVAIKNETHSWKWASIAAIYTTVVAWVVSALVYQIGSLF